jgi:predicted metal-dependent phosphoesterase TrpH
VKCDLHVHSYFSGACTTPFVKNFCRECYSDPAELYAQLRQRGMNLFTFTDHDSIEGSEKFRHLADFFVSAELTCRMPSGTEAHIGVYDVSERQHEQLLRRRGDLVSLLMYLTERRIFFSINHVFSNVTGKREAEDTNRFATRLARRWNKISIGGSDAHALPSAGTAYTEVPGARDKEEFFAGLRNGIGRVGGESGGFRKLTRDVFIIAAEMMREKSWTALLAPLGVLIPGITYLNYRHENKFGRYWAREILGESERRRNARWMPVAQPATEEFI